MNALRVVLFATLLLPQIPGVAAACGNEVMLSTSEARKLLVKAENALAKGKYQAASDMLDDVEVEDSALSRRLTRVHAVAFLRTNRITLGLEMLQGLAKDAPDDPYLKTRIAEGLSLLAKNKEGNRKRALSMLEALDRADLIPDAEGDLTLARLRAGAQDQAGSDKALARCQKRSATPAQCTL